MVDIGCLCPPTPAGEVRHPDGDTVTLRETLDFRTATAIRKSIALIDSDDDSTYSAEVLATLTESYLLWGVESWSLVDAKGKPLEVTRSAIREHLLADFNAATTVADVADELYAPVILLPLLERASKSSPPTPTDGSTSANPSTSTKPPKPSRPSSTSTTPTDVIAPITALPGGVSSSSPN